MATPIRSLPRIAAETRPGYTLPREGIWPFKPLRSHRGCLGFALETLCLINPPLRLTVEGLPRIADVVAGHAWVGLTPGQHLVVARDDSQGSIVLFEGCGQGSDFTIDGELVVYDLHGLRWFGGEIADDMTAWLRDGRREHVGSDGDPTNAADVDWTNRQIDMVVDAFNTAAIGGLPCARDPRWNGRQQNLATWLAEEYDIPVS